MLTVWFTLLIEFSFSALIASNVAAVIVERRTDIDVDAWHIINVSIDVIAVIFIVSFIVNLFKGFLEIMLPFICFYFK